MSNREKLRELIMDVLLLDDSEFSFEMGREDVQTWDSLAVVAISVGVDETFGYHFSPEEAMGIRGVPDIIEKLESQGISFAE